MGFARILCPLWGNMKGCDRIFMLPLDVLPSGIRDALGKEGINEQDLLVALRLDLPSECLKLISAVIVALAIGLPALRAEKKGAV